MFLFIRGFWKEFGFGFRVGGEGRRFREERLGSSWFSLFNVVLYSVDWEIEVLVLRRFV